MTTDKPAIENAVACELISEEFVGAAMVLYLEAMDGTEIKAQLTEGQAHALDLSPGANLWASWPAEAAHVLP